MNTPDQIEAQKALIVAQIEILNQSAELLRTLVVALDPRSESIEWTAKADQLLRDTNQENSRAITYIGKSTDNIKELVNEIFDHHA